MLIWEAPMSNQGQCISQSGEKEPVVETVKVNTQERNSKYMDLLYYISEKYFIHFRKLTK